MTRYVSTTGSNSNDGTLGSPWLTVAYAVANSVYGDIIQIAAGTYNIASQIAVPTGRSLQGAGDTTILSSTVAGGFTFLLESGSQNTNGAQWIRNLKMDGNETAYGAIGIRYRGNVNVNNITVVDFDYFGVSFINGEPPTTYATGNKFYENYITNSAGYHAGSQGCLEIQGQDGMLIYDNYLDADRGGANSGDPIYGVEGFIKNVKIYNNTLKKTFYPGVSSWDFAIEIWNFYEGNEIYGNIATGAIDVTRAWGKGTGDYCVWVHDNFIGQVASTSSESTRGIPLEHNIEDVIIERNYIENVAQGIVFNTQYVDVDVKNVFIQTNILYNIGVSDAGSNSKGWGILWGAGDGDHVGTTIIDNINIWNNVIIGNQGARTCMWGIEIPDSSSTGKNISIRNNIVKDFDYAPTYARQGDMGGVTIDILSIENNIFYNNGFSNLPRYNAITPTNNTTQNNIIDDPDFVSGSDYHIQVGSPAIGAGLDVGLYTDYEENAWDDPPSIGAYAYAGAPPPPPPEVPVASITITAANYFIASNQGTLQLTANVLPLNAFNPSVNWSVTPGTGTASISPSGLLTALSNGYVTVKATAVDGSGVYGERMIDISGQNLNSLKDRDGNIYTTIIIGAQEWIVENLRSTHYADGTIIPNLSECNDPETPENTYGVLYNWHAVDTGLLAPTGWHVATNTDYETTRTFLGGQLIAGIHLKEAGTTHWIAPNTGDNSSGFTGIGSGFRPGVFTDFMETAYYWTSTTGGPTHAIAWWINNALDTFDSTSTAKYYGCAVRCVNNSTSLSDGETSTVTDIDGNVYPTVCIGTKEYMAENLKVTHYNNASVIPIETDNTAWAALVTGAMCYYNNNVVNVSSLTSWTNIDFDNFTSSGPNITTAEESAGTLGHAKSNNISLLAGYTLYFNFDLTVISGSVPRASIYRNDVFVSSVLIVEGPNNLSFSITQNGDYAVGFVSDIAGSEFTAECDMFPSSLNGWLTDTAGAYCWYDNDIANKNPYGALYSKNAVDNVRGLAYLERNGLQESGWRVASSTDVNTLVVFLGITDVGGKLKETGTTHWITPNTGATNEIGFTAVPSGIRLIIGSACSFILKGYQAYMWDTDSNLYYLSNDNDDIASAGYDSHTGAAIRLVRDYVAEDTPDPPIPPTFPDVIPYNYGTIPTYRFYVSTASSITYEVFPLKFLSSTLVNELETNQIFYRNKFNGSLLFGSNSKVINDVGGEQNRLDDWNLFWSIEQVDPSERLYLTINKDFGGVIETYWEGYFSTSDGKFDIDICTFEVTPLAIDDYTDVLDSADVQYNIINVPAMGNVTANLGGIDYIYTRTRWLARIGSDNVLEYIAKQIAGLTAVVQSNFLNPMTVRSPLIGVSVCSGSGISPITVNSRISSSATPL